MDLFSLFVFFFLQCRLSDITLGNCFFQISSYFSYSCAYVCSFFEETKGEFPLGPPLGKQNIQASFLIIDH